MIGAFKYVHKWFRTNLHTINLNKTHCVHFRTKNKSITDLNFVYNNLQITTLSNIKFLDININDLMNWSCHVEYIIPKLSSACYIMRSVKPYMPLNIRTLKTIYYSYFNTVMSYGLLFWGNSLQSSRIFILQKRMIRILTNCNNRVSCRSLFRRLEILPLASQYILSLLRFVINNKNLFTLNSDKYNLNLRHINNFYQPLLYLTTYQNGVYCMGIKVYNSLPPYIKGEFHKKTKLHGLSPRANYTDRPTAACGEFHNPRKFETCLKHFFHVHYFYSLKEYFNINQRK
jgi:hypothetical protein